MSADLSLGVGGVHDKDDAGLKAISISAHADMCMETWADLSVDMCGQTCL